MTNVLLIGDVHRKWQEYTDLLEHHQPERSIQLGDFGWGFEDQFSGDMQDKVEKLEAAMTNCGGGDNKYIRGNHDNPWECENHKFCIPDASYDEETGIFYLGGALSIDKHLRTPGVDWWEDEELNFDRLFAAVDLYEKVKPRIVLTHDCPEDVVHKLFHFYKTDFPSRTRQALGSMWSLHKPELWVFGHWHSHRAVTIEGTHFVCLGELQTMWINV